ncbi:MAG: glycosyltransferase [Lachnospiraceae bacterium]|nr:glycosyltransferase [Lachnospiraceae bacterium]
MTGKKKLMLICPMLHQGGMEKVCVATARALTPYFDITIVIFNSADIAFDVEGLHIIDINIGAKPGKLRKILNIVRRSRKVRGLKRQLKPDIAYSFGPTANMVNAFSKTGKEQVWLGLRSYEDVNEYVKIRLFKSLADLMVCCSKEMERVLKVKYGFKKTTVLYNPFDVEKIREAAAGSTPALPWDMPQEQEDEREIRCFISMGREDDVKGFWHMLKAFSVVHEKAPQSRLILMGDGGFSEYKELAAGLGITDAVYFPGMQRNPYPYLGRAEFYLLASRVEGFPNALVEGMAAGLVPLSVNCLSGPAEILTDSETVASLNDWFAKQKAAGEKPVRYGEYGILIPSLSPEKNLNPAEITEEEKALAEVMLSLLTDEKSAETYRMAGAKRAGIFTFRHYVEQILQMAGVKA